MPAFIDLTNKRFSKLLVLSQAEKSKHGQIRWNCLCDCGNQIIRQGAALRTGSATSCGCAKNENKIIDLTGQQFSRLTAIRQGKRSSSNRVTWICECSCGSQVQVSSNDLRTNKTQSCGCLNDEKRAERNYKHGNATREEKSKEYSSWANMLSRCTNPNTPQYKDYGRRGITVCDRWKSSFSDFLADMGPMSSPNLSIDRIDNDKGYFPENCRWATRKEQGWNRQHHVKRTVDGETKIIAEWAEYLNLPYYKTYNLPLHKMRNLVRAKKHQSRGQGLSRYNKSNQKPPNVKKPPRGAAPDSDLN